MITGSNPVPGVSLIFSFGSGNMDPKDLAKYDQGSASLSELMSTMWWQLFVHLTAKGFTASQALRLIGYYIKAQYSNQTDNIKKPDPDAEP